MKLEFMQKAIEKAKTSENDIPVGAVIVKDNNIIAIAANEKEKNQDATSHAEIIAIKQAGKVLNNWRLNECEMYVTLEPCPMCASAVIQARINCVYFGAYDLLNGAFGSKSDMKMIMNSNISYKGGIMEKECLELLKKYFKGIRK